MSITAPPTSAGPPAAKPHSVVGGHLDGRNVDSAKVAAQAFLSALGVSLDSEHTRNTAARMTDAFVELLTPVDFTWTTFTNPHPSQDMVIAQEIPFTSLCAHHMLPFTGYATVGYQPGSQVLGLSKLARLVEFHARRPQVQEDLTAHIADALAEKLDAAAVGVVVSAEHLCMTIRGARSSGATTLTTAFRGELEFNSTRRREFLSLSAPSGQRG